MIAAWPLLLPLLLPLAASSSSSRNQQNKEEKEEAFNDYEIYEAIDTVKRLTSHDSFYDLIGVPEQASYDEIGKAFRRLSMKMHPDKQPKGTPLEEADRLYRTIQFVGALLRDPKGRERYRWLLHEAPAWHRQSQYTIRKMVKVSRLSLWQSICLALGVILVGQFILQWAAWFIAWAQQRSARGQVSLMGEKEVKRLKRRLEVGDTSFMAATNTSYETLLLAERPLPPMPRLWDLYPFLPLRWLRSRFTQ